MLNRRAQYLPQIWQPIPWPRPNGRELDIITIAVVAALMLEVLVVSVGLFGLVWSRIPAAPVIAAPVVAQPVAQPIAPPVIVPAIAAPVVAEPVVVQPAVAPAPVVAPASVTLPVVQVNWQVVADAPYASALTVKNGNLYVIQNQPGGFFTWRKENGVWVSRPATPEEKSLTWDFRWTDRYPWIVEVLGDPPGITWVKGDKTAFVATRGPVGDDNRYLPRLFLWTEGAWTEVTAPADGKGYGLVVINDKIFVAIGDKIWQVIQQSP